MIRLDVDPPTRDGRAAYPVQRQQQTAAVEPLESVEGNVVTALVGLSQKLVCVEHVILGEDKRNLEQGKRAADERETRLGPHSSVHSRRSFRFLLGLWANGPASTTRQPASG